MDSPGSFLDMEDIAGLVEVKKENPADWLEQEFGMDQDNNLPVPTSVHLPNMSIFSPADCSKVDEKVYNQPPSGDETDSFSLPVHMFQSMLNCVLCGVCNQRKVKIKFKDGVKYPHKFIIFCAACKSTLYV